MHKNVDFLFIYEVKSRELENLCLLKYELEKRNYTVALVNTWYYLSRETLKYNAKVVISHALYNDDVFEFISMYAGKVRKIINMQWEQVGTVLDEIDSKSRFLVTGVAKKAVHISWGYNNKKRLIEKCGIDEKNVKLTGHIALDFLRKEFDGYYLSREELFSKFEIPVNKKVCLFISSFSYVNLPDNLTKDKTLNIGGDINEFINISINSQKIILQWFEEALDKDNELTFIYRPHPAEVKNEALIEFGKKHKNFFVMADLSVKQWVATCDLIYTWYSTSIAEVYFSNKLCHILRPIQMPYARELAMFEDAEFIKNFEHFDRTLYLEKSMFPIEKTIFSKYYDINKIKPTYIRISDVMEEVYKNKNYLLPKEYRNRNKNKLTFAQRIRRLVSDSFLYQILIYFAENTEADFWVLNNIRNKRKSILDEFTLENQKKNYATEEEIESIEVRIKNVLDKH